MSPRPKAPKAPREGAVVRILLRIPAELHAQLVEEAERERRSLNGEIVRRLERTVSGD